MFRFKIEATVYPESSIPDRKQEVVKMNITAENPEDARRKFFDIARSNHYWIGFYNTIRICKGSY